ncbi:DUF6931 family protein [Caulobacter sp. KR2-114]|uniref:DUF6931 family protein n=1 Tax=Caulobacter sp. KR2-114 TaxID=3400912 RepID=UPI003BFC2413
MGRWAKVRWTEAGQVARLLGWAAPDDPLAAPDAFFDDLRSAGRLREAAYFLGQALPRYEAVVWASAAVRHLSPPDQQDPALDAALAWVSDPSEPRRRAAYEAASAADPQSPGRVAALAAYFSGGSISPEGQAAVPAPPTTAGRLGAAAVVMAAVRTDNHSGALAWALDQGNRIAAEGASRP